MARKKCISPSESGSLLARVVEEAKTLYDVNNIIKCQVTNWQNNPTHPERKNYKLRVLGGDEHTLAKFVLEHKDWHMDSSCPDIWELNVRYLWREQGRVEVTIVL